MFLRCTSTHSLVLRSIDSTDKINSDRCTVDRCFQVAPRVLRKRPGKPGDELASAGNWRPCPRHASFGSLMKAKKKKIGRYDLSCNSTGCKGSTSMLRICVSFFFFFCYACTLACCSCSYTVCKLLSSRTFSSWHSPAPY